MKKTLQEIAQIIDGKIICGAPDLVITEAASIDTAGPESITFALEAYVAKAMSSNAAAVIVAQGTESTTKPAITVADPKAAFAKLAYLFAPQVYLEQGISPLAFVHPEAQIGADVCIMPFAMVDKNAKVGAGTVLYPHTYIGQGAQVGEQCIIHAGASVREFCVLGNRVVLLNGAVIGGDGFGFTTDKATGRHSKVPQVGNAVVGDDVEIGCNTCVDRATTYKTSTIIGTGTKIDNLTHIAHNDIIGENCFIIAHVGISGSVQIGNNCTIAGQVGTSGHLKVGDNVVVAGRAGITNDLPSNGAYAGFPAIPHREWLKQQAHISRLPDLAEKVKKLEKLVAELTKDK